VADRTDPKQRTRLALIDAAKARAANGRPLTIADVAQPSIGRHLPLPLQPERSRARGSHMPQDPGTPPRVREGSGVQPGPLTR
jgi:hypothetical protein